MQILRVSQQAYPAVTGGGAYHVHALSRDQAAMGHDVTLLTVRTDPAQPRRERRAGYTVVRTDALVSPLGNAISPGLGRQLLSTPADVVHAHSHLYVATNLAATARALARYGVGPSRPLAITNHGLYSQRAPEWLFDRYLQTLGRRTFDQADVVFCYTDADGGRLREVGVSSRVAVVPNGIDTERFSPTGETTERLETDGPALLFVGRLVEGKRAVDAIRAAQRLRGRYPDLRLFVCGDGPRRPALERRATAETVFLGEVPYGEMPAVYRSADAFVLPSRAEGTPRTVLEALACATPAACSDLPHLRDAFGERVRYFDPGNVEAITAAVEGLLSTPPTGLADAVPDWETTVAETTAVLAELVDRH